MSVKPSQLRVLVALAVISLALPAALGAQPTPRPPAGQEQEKKEPPVNIAGRWHLVIESPHGQVEAELNLKQDAATITGTYSSDGDAPLTGTISGKQVTLTVDMTSMQFGLSGKLENNVLSGETVSGRFPWKATRIK